MFSGYNSISEKYCFGLKYCFALKSLVNSSGRDITWYLTEVKFKKERDGKGIPGGKSWGWEVFGKE